LVFSDFFLKRETQKRWIFLRQFKFPGEITILIRAF